MFHKRIMNDKKQNLQKYAIFLDNLYGMGFNFFSFCLFLNGKPKNKIIFKIQFSTKKKIKKIS